MEPPEEIRELALLLIRGDLAEHRRRLAAPAAPGTPAAYRPFLAALFTLAVRRRLPRGADPGAVAVVVAEVRRHWDAGVDPAAAARLIGAALGRVRPGEPAADVDAAARLRELFVCHLLSRPGPGALAAGEPEALLDEAARLAGAGPGGA